MLCLIGSLELNTMALFSRILYVSKALYIVAAVIVSTSYGVVASLILSALRRRGLSQYTTGRMFYYLARPVLGIDFKFIGNNYHKYLAAPKTFSELFASSTPPNSDFLRPCVIVSNHQSALDVYMLGKIFPPYCSVTSKESLKYVPFLGWFMSLSGTVFLDRKNSARSVAVLQGTAHKHTAKSKQSVFIFPEGTRSGALKPHLSPLKKGAFHLAIEAQVPIVPIVLSNTSNLFQSKKMLLRSGTIKVKVLDPIPTIGMTKNDVSQLCEKVEKLMKEAVAELGYSELAGEAEKSGDEDDDDEERQALLLNDIESQSTTDISQEPATIQSIQEQEQQPLL